MLAESPLKALFSCCLARDILLCCASDTSNYQSTHGSFPSGCASKPSNRFCLCSHVVVHPQPTPLVPKLCCVLICCYNNHFYLLDVPRGSLGGESPGEGGLLVTGDTPGLALGHEGPARGGQPQARRVSGGHVENHGGRYDASAANGRGSGGWWSLEVVSPLWTKHLPQTQGCDDVGSTVVHAM